MANNPFELDNLPVFNNTPDFNTIPKSEVDYTKQLQIYSQPFSGVANTYTTPTKDPFQSLLTYKSATNNSPEFSYSSILDERYSGKEVYSPQKDTEFIYAENQGTLGRLGRRLDQAFDNLNYTFVNGYIGLGKSFEDWQDGSKGFGKAFMEGYINFTSQDAALDMDRDLYKKPIYQSREFAKNPDAFWSLEGALGSGVESLGYMGGAIAQIAVDNMIGAAIREITVAAVAAAPLTYGASLLAPAAIFGSQALVLNDSVRKVIGEDFANMYLGMMVSGDIAAVGGRILKPGLAAEVRNAFKLSNIRNIKTSLYEVAKAQANFTRAGTLADTTGELTRAAKTYNTINKIKDLGVFATRAWLSSGGEAAIEALHAQKEFIEERVSDFVSKNGYMPEGQELESIKSLSNRVSNDVNEYNRMLLSITNGFALKSFFESPLKGFISRFPLALEGGKVISKYSGKKALANYFLKTGQQSLVEGMEEANQYVISSGVKDYYRQNSKDRQWVESLREGLAAAYTTREGLYEGFVGALFGGGTHTVASVNNGIKTLRQKKGFMSGFTGFDKEHIDKVVTTLNELIIDSKKTNTSLQETLANGLKDKKSIAQIKQQIERNNFRLMYSLYKNGLSDKFNKIADDIFSELTNNSIEQLYEGVSFEHSGKEYTLGQLPQDTRESLVESFKTQQKEILINDAKSIANKVTLATKLFNDPYTENYLTKLFSKNKTDNRQNRIDMANLFENSVYAMYHLEKQNLDFEKMIEDLKEGYSGKVNKNSLLFKVIEETDDGKLTILDFITTSKDGFNMYSDYVDQTIEETKKDLELLSANNLVDTKDEVRQKKNLLARFTTLQKEIKEAKISKSKDPLFDFIISKARKNLNQSRVKSIESLLNRKDRFDLLNEAGIEGYSIEGEDVYYTNDDGKVLVSKKTNLKAIADHLLKTAAELQSSQEAEIIAIETKYKRISNLLIRSLDNDLRKALAAIDETDLIDLRTEVEEEVFYEKLGEDKALEDEYEEQLEELAEINDEILALPDTATKEDVIKVLLTSKALSFNLTGNKDLKEAFDLLVEELLNTNNSQPKNSIDDIEKRRQEELDSNAHNLIVETELYEDGDGRKYLVHTLKDGRKRLDNAGKNEKRTSTSDIYDGSVPVESYIYDAKKIKDIDVVNTVEEKINAKYDAELNNLKTNTTSTALDHKTWINKMITSSKFAKLKGASRLFLEIENDQKDGGLFNVIYDYYVEDEKLETVKTQFQGDLDTARTIEVTEQDIEKASKEYVKMKKELEAQRENLRKTYQEKADKVAEEQNEKIDKEIALLSSSVFTDKVNAFGKLVKETNEQEYEENAPKIESYLQDRLWEDIATVRTLQELKQSLTVVKQNVEGFLNDNTRASYLERLYKSNKKIDTEVAEELATQEEEETPPAPATFSEPQQQEINDFYATLESQLSPVNYQAVLEFVKQKIITFECV